MVIFSLVMMRISLELAKTDAVYEGLATKFFEHYVYIGAAMKMIRGDRTLWDADDGFFYDILRLPDGTGVPFRVRSLVGLIPLYAIERLEKEWIEPFPVFRDNMNWFIKHRRDIVERCVTTVQDKDTFTHVLAVVDQNQLQHLLNRVVDSHEFLSPFGMRSLSKLEKACGGDVRVTVTEEGDGHVAAAGMTDSRASEGIGAGARARGLTIG